MLDDVLGPARLREVGGHRQRRPDRLASLLRPLPVAPAHDDERTFGSKLPRDLQADPGGRAGHDAHAVAEAEIHVATVAGWRPTTILLVRHGETGWNAEGRIQGHDEPAAERARPRAGAGAGERARRRARARRLRQRPRPGARDGGDPGAAARSPRRRSTQRSASATSASWEGRTVAELEEQLPGAWARWRDGNEAAGTSRITWRWPSGSAERSAGSPASIPATRSSSSHTAARCACSLMDADGLPYPEGRQGFGRIANCDLSRIAVEDGTIRRID